LWNKDAVMSVASNHRLRLCQGVGG
jgi:hypothetical protein